MNDDPLADVSRETLEKLRAYEALLLKWTQHINLISKNTYSETWSRHIKDSAQIYWPAETQSSRWIDVGSGGGLPGIVCAILDREQQNQRHFVLIESDQRKGAFLRTVIRSLDLNAIVREQRVETLEPLNANVISARAFARLDKIFSLCQRHLTPEGQLVLLKGATHADEVVEARRQWCFKLKQQPSATDPSATVLTVGELAFAQPKHLSQTEDHRGS